MAICCRPLQGIEVPSSCLNEGQFNWEVSLCTHFRPLSVLKLSQYPCKSNRLHFQSAAAVGYDQSQTEAELQVPKRRGRPKKSSNAAQSLHKPKISSKTKPAAQQEIHSGEVTENVLQGEQKKHEGHLFKYSEVVPKVSFQQYDNQHELSAGLLKYIVQVSKESIEARGWFTIALSGGSIVKALGKLVDEPGIAWSRWHVFWVDERVVPLNHEDSNYKLALETFLKYVDVPNYQIHSIQYTRDANMVAKKYDRFLRELTKPKILSLDPSQRFPCFDMVLLGIGPDGHVASLFPNSLALAEENAWVVAVLNSPKPPPQRISLTLPCINSASHVAFIVFGSSKAEILQRVLERPALPGSLPAQMVRPYYGSLSWFVDKEAASKLSVETWDDPKRFPAINFGSEKKMPTA